MRNTLTLTILVICLKTGSGLLSQKPQGSVAVAGKSTYFNCSTSDLSKPIEWYHYYSNEVQRESIYRYSNFTEYWYPCYRNGRYVVEGNKAAGAHNLVIPTVVSSDAGRFLCEVEGDEGMATLTVKESKMGVHVSEEEAGHSSPIISSEGNKEPDANDKMANTEASSPETEQLLPARNDLTTKINELEAVLERERSEAKSLEKHLRTEIGHLQEKNKASESEIRHLKAKVKDLEQSFYPAGNIDYGEKLTWKHRIITDAGNKLREHINGMTILGKELFVSHENNSVIEVYDCETFQFGLNWKIEGISHPMDIASCNISNCLYIIFREDTDSESHLMKLYPKGEVINKWSTGGERGRLSTYGSNVIVCLFEKQLINEYTRDGNLVHTVPLLLDFGFKHPSHAIKVTGSHFVVCHGDAKDELHRVCIVDIQGNILKELKEWDSKQKDGKLNVPICLAADSDRSILVADRDNQKIRLLNCHLRLQRNLIKQDRVLDGYPVRICLDETKKLLYVATTTLGKNEDKEGRITIFSIK